MPILEIVELGMRILRGLGLIKDPKEEKEYQLKLLELVQAGELAKSREYEAFLKATTPDADRVYMLGNTFIALTRPAITWLIILSIIFAPDRLSQALQGISQAGTVGFMILTPVLWWFFGRDIVKIFGGPMNGILERSSTNNQPESARDIIDRMVRRVEQVSKIIDGTKARAQGSQAHQNQEIENEFEREYRYRGGRVE